jgi:hypothetical protein
VAVLSLVDSSAVAGGVRYFWLDDDQMVAMRYARNLASGHGLTFNPGQAVEGYTSLLWTLVMAAVHLLPVSDAKASLVVALVNWGLAGGVLVLVRRLGILWGLGRQSLVLAVGTFSVALSFELLYYTAHGFETTLLMLVFLWVVCRLVEEARSRAPRLPTYLGAGLLPLVRSDFLALLAVIPLAALALGRSRSGAPRRGLPVAAYAAAALLPPLCHLVLRHAIYGRWLPNAYHLKVAGVAPSFLLLGGVRYAGGFLLQHGPLVVASVYAAIKGYATGAGRCLLGLLLAIGGVLITGGDIFPGFRFFAPFVPLLALLSFVVVDRTVAGAGARAALALALCLLGSSVQVAARQSLDELLVDGNGGPEPSLLVALALRDHTSPAARVAVHAAGMIPYFSHRHAIDVLGKTDAHVAALPPHPGEPIGHNKYDAAYSLGEQGADVVALLWFPAAADGCQPAIAPFLAPWVAQIVRSEVFQRQYCMHKVVVPGVSKLPLFVRDGSPEIGRLVPLPP